jgi:DNA polymerase elongation subunit (family B)
MNLETAFDIETIPNTAIIDRLPPPEIKYGNAKDPAKRAEIEKEAKASQIEKLGLSPLTGRICCAAFFGATVSEVEVTPEITDTEEIKLINYIFDRLGKYCYTHDENDIIITCNGSEFDFRFLYVRAAILKVELPPQCPPLAFWTKRYSHKPHCDIQREITSWSSQATGYNLDAMGRMIVGCGKTTRDYSTYVKLIENGEGGQIATDCLCDTQLTYLIYKTLKPYLF